MDFTNQIILLFHPVINPSKDSLKERTYQKAPVSFAATPASFPQVCKVKREPQLAINCF